MRCWPGLLLLSACSAAHPGLVSIDDTADDCFHRVTADYKACLGDVDLRAAARLGVHPVNNLSAYGIERDLEGQGEADSCRVRHEGELRACAARAQADALLLAEGAQAPHAAVSCAAWCDFALPRLEVCSGEARGARAGGRADCIAKSLAGDPTGLACTQLLAQERGLACPEFLRGHGK